MWTSRIKRAFAVRTSKPLRTNTTLQLENLEDRMMLHAGHLDEPLSHLLPGGATSSVSNRVLLTNPQFAPAVPAYSSLPGAKATLYLDFNGHYQQSWGNYSNITTPVFDT